MFLEISGGNGPSPHPPIQQFPDVLDGMGGSLLAMAEHCHSCLAGNHAQNEQYDWWHCHAGGSCQDEPTGRVPHEGGGCLPCNAHSVEIACNDDKLSPRMLCHTAPDHDGPSTSKSIPLQSTGLEEMSVTPTINANPTCRVRQNRDLSVKSTFCQSCLVQRWWVCAHRRRCCR